MTPDQYTNKEFFIEVGGGHQLYVYDWGNPKGMPIIFVHGGPGGNVRDNHKRSFNPQLHHVIFFDQRGCGKSLPYGSLKHNTTADLLDDITEIAKRVTFKQFTLVGGSWGSCLALTYAIAHPARVKSMVLYSIYTGTKWENDWVDDGLFKTHYPEVWERFLSHTPKAHHKNPAAYHYKNIADDKAQLATSSALALQEMEYSLMALDDPGPALDPATFDSTDARIYAHYISNNCFLPEGHILENALKLTMPIQLVHGRFDMCCPPITVYELDKKLPNSNLIWTISGHWNEHEDRSVMRAVLLQLAGKA